MLCLPKLYAEIKMRCEHKFGMGRRNNFSHCKVCSQALLHPGEGKVESGKKPMVIILRLVGLFYFKSNILLKHIAKVLR